MKDMTRMGKDMKTGTSMNGNKERQENDLKKYRDGTSMKENREVQQQDGQRNISRR